MRRELAVYTEKHQLLHRAWIEEEDIPSFTERRHSDGFLVVDVVLLGNALAGDPTDSAGRLDHILRNPQSLFGEPDLP